MSESVVFLGMRFGKMTFYPALSHPDLVSRPTKRSLEQHNLAEVLVGHIDPALADTAAFCQEYNIGLEVSANCVIVEARRGDKTWCATCVILATAKADINGVVRRQLDARKISFASMDKAVTLSAMEYGGITPIGLPADWPVLVDTGVTQTDYVVIGSGIRSSKLLVPGALLGRLPNATVMRITKNTKE